MKLYGLKALHSQMKSNGDERAAFNVTIKGKEFACLFLTNTKPYYLFLSTLGVNIISFEFPIEFGYVISDWIENAAYKSLIEYLGIKYDNEHKFIPIDFFRILDNKIYNLNYHIPNASDILREVSKNRDIEDADKVYFLCFKRLPEGQKVSPKNYEKTSFAFGEKKADLFRKERISTCWTDKQTEENLNLLNKYF